MAQILLFLTGLFFLLFGMVRLSDGLQPVLGSRIRHWIKHLVKKPARGIGLGALATGIFQSSATVIMMTIGAVSAGLISFADSLGLILGANIGTTITAQLVAFKITSICPVFIVIGVLLWFFGKDRAKLLGEAVFYFGLLFFGLSLISQAILPLKGNPVFVDLLQQVRNPLFGILIGFLLTIILQSSSATTGILVLFGMQGLIGIESALPIILGANIGTTLTPFVLSLGSGINARRAGFSNVLFTLFGVAIVLPFLPYFISLLKILTPSTAQQIATSHLLFNIGLICILFFLLKPFAKQIQKIIPGEEKILPLWPEYLNAKLLSQPGLALEAVRKELKRGMLLTQKMFSDAMKIIFDWKSRGLRDIGYVELVVDGLQREVMKFMDKLPQGLSKTEAVKLINYSAIIDNVERIGDHASNLGKLARHKRRAGVTFSEAGKEEIKELEEIVARNIADTISLIEKEDEQKIKDIFIREEEVDQKVRIAKENHLERFYRRECAAADAPIFNDILINFERISDHCVNIAKYFARIKGYKKE